MRLSSRDSLLLIIGLFVVHIVLIYIDGMLWEQQLELPPQNNNKSEHIVIGYKALFFNTANRIVIISFAAFLAIQRVKFFTKGYDFKPFLKIQIIILFLVWTFRLFLNFM